MPSVSRPATPLLRTTPEAFALPEGSGRATRPRSRLCQPFERCRGRARKYLSPGYGLTGSRSDMRVGVKLRRRAEIPRQRVRRLSDWTAMPAAYDRRVGCDQEGSAAHPPVLIELCCEGRAFAGGSAGCPSLRLDQSVLAKRRTARSPRRRYACVTPEASRCPSAPSSEFSRRPDTAFCSSRSNHERRPSGRTRCDS